MDKVQTNHKQLHNKKDRNTSNQDIKKKNAVWEHKSS